MNTTKRYFQLVLIGLVPSLAGCLSDFHLKADVDLETEEASRASEAAPEDGSKTPSSSPGADEALEPSQD